MTEEERNALQVRLDAAEAELAKTKGENETLVKNQANQNAYITKLEEKANGLSGQIKNIQDTANKPVLDPTITNYFKERFVKDRIEEGKAEIKSRDTMNSFPILEKELDEFLKQFMNETNASNKFILDSYSLILGRAIANPDHPINKKKDDGAPSQAQPQPAPTPIVKPAFPPIMTNEDQGAGNPAAKKTITVPDTKSAFRVLEERLFNQGQNKFE